MSQDSLVLQKDGIYTYSQL